MKIIDLGINGEGIAKEDGKVFFLDGGLIDEEVEYEITEENDKFSRGKVTKVIKESKDRQNPNCPYFGLCGGCQLQHLKYEEQLKYKQKLVQNTLKKISDIDVEVNPTFASDKIYNYRNKSVFQVFNMKGLMTFGMFENKSNNGLKIENCSIANETINKVLKITQDFYKNEVNNTNIRYLVVRVINDEPLITLVVRNRGVRKLQWYVETLKNNFQEFSLNLNINNNPKIILSNDYENVYGKNYLELTEFGINYNLNSGSFLQINDYIKGHIYQQILDNINSDEIVVDAYSGAGLLSSIIAKKCRYVYGVEVYREAIKSAEELMKKNDIKNLSFICGKCEVEIPKILPNIEENFTIILDPPRRGCDDEVLNSILSTMPTKIIYLSCNPITLAKDLKRLLEGYEIESINPYDMFPQTTDVETLVILKKKK